MGSTPVEGMRQKQNLHEGSATDSANTWGALEPDWSFRGPPSQAKVAKVLRPCPSISGCVLLRNVYGFGQGGSLQMGRSLKGLIAKDAISPTLSGAGMSTSLKGEYHGVHTYHMLNFFITQHLLHKLLSSAVNYVYLPFHISILLLSPSLGVIGCNIDLRVKHTWPESQLRPLLAM